MWLKLIIYSIDIKVFIMVIILNNCLINYKEGIWFIIYW